MEAYDLRAEIARASASSFQEGMPDPFQPLDRLIEAVEETRQTQGLAEISGEALLIQPVQPPAYYLHGFALARLGRTEAAAKTLASLCGKLEQESRWETLAALLPKIIEAAPTVEAARSFAKVGETLGIGGLDRETLKRVYDLYPDEERLAYLMGESAAAEGNPEDALGYWAESLEGFVALKKYDRLEEALLKVVESESVEHQRHIFNVLRRLIDQNQWARFNTLLDLTLPGLNKTGLIGDLWKLILHAFAKAPEAAGLRKWVRTLAPEAFPAAEGILDLLGRSGVLDPQIKAETSIQQLETLLEYAPGYYVLHASWGIGRVRLNDGDTLVLDFKESKNHRMKLTLARRALGVLDPEDLRVIQSEDPEALKRLLRESPADVIVRALRMTRGEASAQDLRRTLAGQGIVPAQSWTGFWKEARAAMEDDLRLDLSQSFRQIYRLRAESDDVKGLTPLPMIEPRRGVRPNLNLIRRFLDQHPEEKARAARTYSPILERWAKDERTSAEDRLAVHLQLQRWRGETREDFVAALAGCLDENVEMSSFADSADQRFLAEVALASAEHWNRGVLFVLSSRDASIRALAVERMRGDPGEARSQLSELLHDPAARPLAALSTIDLTLSEPPEAWAPDPWLAAMSAALLIDTAAKEPIRKQALAWLSVTGPLAERLRQVDPAVGNAERWETVLKRWRSSERFLRPVLDFLSATGHGELVGAMRAAHAERTDRILGAVGGAGVTDYRGHLMTRATYQRLLHERNGLVWELKNTVAKAIQRAREFGDLSENAEYESAKMKQADYGRRVTDLSVRLAEAKLIENLSVPLEEAAPGTEIVVEDVLTRERKTFWILGEGDDWIAQHVISYAAPLGRNLLGKRTGERVSIIGPDSVHEYVIRGVQKRLPASEDAAEEPEVSEVELREIAEGIAGEAPAGGPDG